uniref:Uncharacterized protein n=1 Tax=Siphoviridae sp. ctTDf8 TaxID=2825517 RepID=A0A8S5UJ73_9CAUD|nr:MAG TPA: hypothetical protein [Siphoviridae sp. ctTDf8]
MRRIKTADEQQKSRGETLGFRYFAASETMKMIYGVRLRLMWPVMTDS